MYPTLLQLGSLRLDSYNVLWLLSLSWAILWSTRRFPLYDVDDGEARRVIGWSFLAMLLGARAFEYISNIRDYIADPALLLDLNRGGLSEVGAFTGAFLTALLLCRHNPKISFQRLCGVVALPAMLTMAVGRWGCFLNGCCVGVVSNCPLALHFPRDPAGVTRHPTQLYYSVCAAAFLLLLWPVERALLRRALLRGELQQRAEERGALITSLGLILYSAMRFGVDILRADSPIGSMSLSHQVLLAALPLECVWLLRSLRALRRA